MGDFSGNCNGTQVNFVIQKTKTANVTNKSMPEGMNLRVLLSLKIKLKHNKIFKHARNIHDPRGAKVMPQSPAKTKMPLPKPMMSEILLPFLNPSKPPAIRNRP